MHRKISLHCATLNAHKRCTHELCRCTCHQPRPVGYAHDEEPTIEYPEARRG